MLLVWLIAFIIAVGLILKLSVVLSLVLLILLLELVMLGYPECAALSASKGNTSELLRDMLDNV